MSRNRWTSPLAHLPRAFAAACLTATLLLPAATRAQEPAAETKLTKKVVFQSLDNPSGLAVQPGTNHVFVAARPAIYRLVPGKDEEYGTAHAVVHGYPTDVYGKGPMYDIGPLGLAFLKPNLLVVGDGSRKDGEELARIYEVGSEPEADGKSQLERDAKHTLGPIPMQEGVTASGEGNFYGVAVGGGAIFFSCNGDDTKGWVARAKVEEEDQPGKLETYIATKEATMVDAPVPLTFDPEGKLLVVGQMGEINVPGDSLLTMYDPATGKLEKNLKTGLNDISGLAYHPKTGKLYATDFSWMDATKGGLFRLDVEGDEVKAVRLLDLDKPTALAFDGEGRLYVTVFGTAEEVKEGDPAKPAGQVLLVEGEI
ncbi:MAG: hypothetical protein WD069_13250 [Planctomycetales bacterium]